MWHDKAMQVQITHPTAFEKWSPDTPDTIGIGGSETSQAELSWRLARRGHQVTSYAPVPWTGPREWRGSTWAPIEEADYSQPGIWLIYRSPETLDRFPESHPGQELWFVAQDASYPTLTEERRRKLDWFMALCQLQGDRMVETYPDLKGKVRVSSNGLKMELIREVEAEGIPERNPRKLIWSSSWDRGLLYLLKTFKRAREWVSNLELVIAYGDDNIQKLVALGPRYSHLKKMTDEIRILAGQPGVTMLGRINQRRLYQEYLTCGIWPYQTNFNETSSINCQESQALGAIPITAPIWALAENVMHGTFIWGDAWNDPLTQARYVGEIYRLATTPALQSSIRPTMMRDARERFHWERIVDKLESWMCGFSEHPMVICQFAFQLKHTHGSILNIGCADDPADLKRKGAVNLDINAYDIAFKRPNKADIVADCRLLPGPLNGTRFQSVVLGEILEHFDVNDAVGVIRAARNCLAPGGRLVITVPNEHRAPDQQHDWANGTEEYAPGIHACHTHPVPEAMLRQWLADSGLRAEILQPIDYGPMLGWGVVARAEE